MACFADVVLKCNKRIGKLILADITDLVSGGQDIVSWRVAEKSMKEAAGMMLEPFVYFNYYKDGEDVPYALLSLNYNSGEYSLEDGKLWIANVVPFTKSHLENEEYNDIVKKFHDEILAPLVKSKWKDFKLEFLMPQQGACKQISHRRSVINRMYFDFIIGEDSNGNELRYSCDPSGLRNFFGSNPSAPYYLTAVYFKIAVLDKYLDVPSQYDVEPGCLRCKGSNGVDWCVPIDNHGDECVTVWLGDLGGLPYDEQLHFASYNVPKGKMSEMYFKSQIDAEFCDSKHPIQVFKAEYQKLYDTFADKLEWPLLLPLAEADRHYLSSLKLLTCDEQKEFDEQVLALTKILVDSINEKELKKFGCEVKASGSINLLESVVRSIDIQGFDRHLAFLRNLQDLRSSCVAHRKGSRYMQVADRVELNAKTKTEVFHNMIDGAIEFCRFMRANVCSFRVEVCR